MTAQKLKDKVAVTTGGGGGIGRQTPLGMAAKGAKIVVAGRYRDEIVGRRAEGL